MQRQAWRSRSAIRRVRSRPSRSATVSGFCGGFTGGRGRTSVRPGILSNPFDELEATERRRLFPGGATKKAPPFTRDQLRALYNLLPATPTARCGLRRTRGCAGTRS